MGIHGEQNEARLMDHNDLYVLDFGEKLINCQMYWTNVTRLVALLAPSLKTLALMAVMQHKLNLDVLPESIRQVHIRLQCVPIDLTLVYIYRRWEIRAMTLPNNVTKPLNNAG